MRVDYDLEFYFAYPVRPARLASAAAKSIWPTPGFPPGRTLGLFVNTGGGGPPTPEGLEAKVEGFGLGGGGGGPLEPVLNEGVGLLDGLWDSLVWPAAAARLAAKIPASPFTCPIPGITATGAEEESATFKPSPIGGDLAAALWKFGVGAAGGGRAACRLGAAGGRGSSCK
jgi:hypothetical protein